MKRVILGIVAAAALTAGPAAAPAHACGPSEICLLGDTIRETTGAVVGTVDHATWQLQRILCGDEGC